MQVYAGPMAPMSCETVTFRMGHAMQSHRESPTAQRYGIDRRARCMQHHPRGHCVPPAISAARRRYRYAAPSRRATLRAEQGRHSGFGPPERIAPTDRTLSRRRRLAAIDRHVVSRARRNRSAEQAQCDKTACQFPKIVEFLIMISPRLNASYSE